MHACTRLYIGARLGGEGEVAGEATCWGWEDRRSDVPRVCAPAGMVRRGCCGSRS